MKTIINLACFIALACSITPASAATSCITPEIPPISASFTNLAEAEVAEALLQSYVQGIGQFQSCLANEWDALGENITAEEEAELKGLKAATLSAAQTIAARYNSAVIALHQTE